MPHTRLFAPGRQAETTASRRIFDPRSASRRARSPNFWPELIELITSHNRTSVCRVHMPDAADSPPRKGSIADMMRKGASDVMSSFSSGAKRSRVAASGDFDDVSEAGAATPASGAGPKSDPATATTRRKGGGIVQRAVQFLSPKTSKAQARSASRGGGGREAGRRRRGGRARARPRRRARCSPRSTRRGRADAGSPVPRGGDGRRHAPRARAAGRRRARRARPDRTTPRSARPRGGRTPRRRRARAWRTW